jgi:phosphinothricin acetyltransferase
VNGEIRRATSDDAAAIARIYNDGIADRIATFETEPRTEAQVRAWFERPHPIVVAFAAARATRANARLGFREVGTF